MSFNIVNVSLALDNIKNIFIFYKNINIIIGNLYDILQRMKLLCEKYINTTLMNDIKDSICQEYNMLYKELTTMENIKYNGLKIISFIDSVPSTYYENGIIKDQGTRYRFYVYINTLDSSSYYTEYDNGYNKLDVRKFNNDSECITQINNLTLLIDIVYNKIKSICTWYDILKEKKRIFEDINNNVNTYDKKELDIRECLNYNIKSEILMNNKKLNKNDNIEYNIEKFKRKYKREIRSYINKLLEKITKLEEKNEKYKRYIKRSKR